MSTLQEKLFSLADESYRDFLAKLIPNISKNSIIGIRVPILRQFFRENRDLLDENFLAHLPHKYHEENLLHIFYVNSITNFSLCEAETERFFPYIDNWAVSDSFNPKIFAKNPEKIYPKMLDFVKNGANYEKRASLNFLMKNFLWESFRLEILETIAKIESDDYYLDMMIAWFFAESLVANYDAAFPFIERKIFKKFIQNKIISKARESRKIDEKTKDFLKNFCV